MKKSSLLLIGLAVGVNASFGDDDWVAVGHVAAPLSVPEAKPAARQTAAAYPASTSAPSPTLQSELLDLVEVMQQEIGELRAQLEEQGHRVKLLERQQQQRYLDVDRRLGVLEGGALEGSVSAHAPAAVSSDSASTGGRAEDAYAKAMSHIKSKDFSQALSLLAVFIEDYPEHTLAVNALYWTGEVKLAQGQVDQAIQAFSRLATSSPKHAKAADALYKLALAYERKGLNDKAKKSYRVLVGRYDGQGVRVLDLAKQALKRLESL